MPYPALFEGGSLDETPPAKNQPIRAPPSFFIISNSSGNDDNDTFLTRVIASEGRCDLFVFGVFVGCERYQLKASSHPSNVDGSWMCPFLTFASLSLAVTKIIRNHVIEERRNN
jgi:hypothetical protein